MLHWKETPARARGICQEGSHSLLGVVGKVFRCILLQRQWKYFEVVSSVCVCPSLQQFLSGQTQMVKLMEDCQGLSFSSQQWFDNLA